MKLNAKKDGKGNVIITEDSFEMLLACLDNQKFVHEAPQNGDSLSVGEEVYTSTQESIQKAIDEYNKAARDILHSKFKYGTTFNGYCLLREYENQNGAIPWSNEDVNKISKLFNGKLIERSLPYDNMYLTIADGGEQDRQWTNEEIEKIKELLPR